MSTSETWHPSTRFRERERVRGRGRTKLLSEVRKCIFSTEKKLKLKNIQITKADQMIVFSNAMWSIFAHSGIRPFFVR